MHCCGERAVVTADDSIFDQALDWHVRLASDDADWEGFTVWLEESPEHRAAYELVTLQDRELEAFVQTHALAFPVNDDDVSDDGANIVWHVKWRRELVAASIALLAAPFALTSLRAPAPEFFQTPANGSQTIALGNGASILLDRNSRLSLQEGAVPKIELLAGAAYFEAPSDPDQSFAIKVGNSELRDLGTQFSVTYSEGFIKVAVADGLVEARLTEANPLKVRKGQQLILDEAKSEAQFDDIDVSDIAAWRNGKLVYNNAPLPLVVADEARYTGQNISVDAALQDSRFSGVLDASKTTQILSSLTLIVGAKAEKRGNEVRLVPSN